MDNFFIVHCLKNDEFFWR